MGRETSIGWTATPQPDGTLLPGATFSPWWGCERISPACGDASGGGCYAEAFSHRLGLALWGEGSPRRFFGDKHWQEPLRWNRDAQKRGVRMRVFCASMADVFEDRRDLDVWREKLWALIDKTPWLDWLLLTKRPERIPELVPASWLVPDGRRVHFLGAPVVYPPENVWMGATAETTARFKHALRHLSRVAGLRFLSCEPLLEAIRDERNALQFFDWVIVGGESGPKSRPMDVHWVRSLRDACRQNGIPLYVKQTGHKLVGSDGLMQIRRTKGEHIEDLPADLRIREWPEPQRSE